LKQVIVFVSSLILEVEQVFPVLLPVEGVDTLLGIIGDDPVIVLAKGFDPYIGYSFVGGYISQPFPVRGEPRQGSIGVLQYKRPRK
jgi:hypothetical protein